MEKYFDISNISGKTILIKTFAFESGLWYLAKSLGDTLSAKNNVIYISKAKYTRVNGSGPFKRIYPDPRNAEEFGANKIVNFSNKYSVESQISKAIKNNRADIIISFETLMQTGQWVESVKQGHGVRVYDIPMPEWVTRGFVENKSYKVFDKVLCLTDTCWNIFKNYENAERCSWNYVDKDIFTGDRTAGFDTINFYHQASTNLDCSHKNTDSVIEAFVEFSRSKKSVPASLTITGSVSDEQRAFVESVGLNSNILIINDFLSKIDIASIYKNTHCVVAPSTKEGLGLSFYEAYESGCSIITTNADPMNKHSEYLCDVVSFKKDECMVDSAITTVSSIVKNFEKVYGDLLMSKKMKVLDVDSNKQKKTDGEIQEENDALLAAFSDNDSAGDSVGEPLDNDVLNRLKDMSKKKSASSEEDSEVPTLVDEQEVSINFAVIGVGQAGSRIAEEFHRLGYDVGVVNTSAQDLKYIDVLDNQKLLLEGSLGGTGKDLDLGREIFMENEDELERFVNGVLEGNEMTYLAVSGGGGTGSSSVDSIVPILFNSGMPVGVIYVLPKATEDAQSKRNSIETLARLAKMTKDSVISSLVVVDNARIEQIYANLSQSKFWEAANNAIVEPLHLFNHLTSQPSRHTSLDPSDFGKIVSCGDCSVYGVIEVSDYMEETSLAEAVIESLSANMLAEGFDLSQTRSGGVIITGSKDVLDRLPSININYCFHMISEQTNGSSVFQGIYDVDTGSDSVKIYTWFAGLGLPQDRIDSLKKESQEQARIASEKEKTRASAMTLDLEEDQVNSVTKEVTRKIQKKKSGFNKLQRGSRGLSSKSIIDRRKRK